MSSLLDRLNTLRTSAGMKPLKSWKASRAKLEEAIAALTPSNDRTSDFADMCREYGVNPKVGRALYRRHVGPVAEYDHNDAKQQKRARELLAASSQRTAA